MDDYSAFDEPVIRKEQAKAFKILDGMDSFMKVSSCDVYSGLR
nr:unnamed protein product [Callosobruchus analis]